MFILIGNDPFLMVMVPNWSLDWQNVVAKGRVIIINKADVRVLPKFIEYNTKTITFAFRLSA